MFVHACEVAALVFPALISPMVSVDVKQHLQHPLHGRSGSRYHLCTLVTDYLAFVCTERAKIVGLAVGGMLTHRQNTIIAEGSQC